MTTPAEQAALFTAAMAETAEYAVRRHSGDCDRAMAVVSLQCWDGYSQITMAVREAVLAKFPEREPFGHDFFLEDLGAIAVPHRIIASGPDGFGGWAAECACTWKRTGYFSQAVLAMAVDEHLENHVLPVKAVW